MKKNTVSVPNAITTVAFYFLLSTLIPQISFGTSATALAILTAVSYFLYSAFAKKK
ncbi:hypothetical protein JAO78_000495 [Alishewanella sp. 16-MA]|uniref:Uncharacterized protein n=1 Tax=Alishewanella maricola TaxID=2795740 RepID=A0ABS8BYZ9_9ALTE|nr:hypothetical protein [Alishewanella maricola]MCB5225295.1 hypothetical protein [Alishewanella maricola]